VQFYTDHIQFHIGLLIVSCEQFVIIYVKQCDGEMAYRMFFSGRSFASGLLCTPKTSKI